MPVEYVTAAGLVIEDEAGVRFSGFSCLPLRLALLDLSKSAWSALGASKRSRSEIVNAVGVVAAEYVESLTFVDRDAEWRNQDALRDWYEDSDIAFWYEFMPDDWLEREALWHGIKWSWSDIYHLTTLVLIDKAVSDIELGEPFKAAVWAFRATEARSAAMQMAEWARSRADALAALSRQGAFMRHQANREARGKAIQLYAAREWQSLSHAARTIALKVNRVEAVVLRWLREYQKAKADRAT